MKSEFPIIKTDRILLREITALDLENIFNGLSNPNVIQHYGISFDSLEKAKEQMIWFADKKQMWWAICSLDNKTFYGAGGLNDINDKENKAEIGLWLLPDFWGNGIMKEVLPLISDYGFKNLKLNRIEGFVETENLNCKNAMSKLDFKNEGTIKDFEIKNGKSISVDIYAKQIDCTKHYTQQQGFRWVRSTNNETRVEQNRLLIVCSSLQKWRVLGIFKVGFVLIKKV